MRLQLGKGGDNMKRGFICALVLAVLLSLASVTMAAPFNGYAEGEYNVKAETMGLELGVYRDLSPALRLGGAIRFDTGEVANVLDKTAGYDVYAELRTKVLVLRLTGTKVPSVSELGMKVSARIDF
jgi:hypothetical protein